MFDKLICKIEEKYKECIQQYDYSGEFRQIIDDIKDKNNQLTNRESEFREDIGEWTEDSILRWLDREYGFNSVDSWDIKWRDEQLRTCLRFIYDEINRYVLVEPFLGQNSVVVGANGSGKTSFAAYLQESVSKNIVVIPAQKRMICSTIQTSNNEFLESYQTSNFIKEIRSRDRDVNDIVNKLEKIFTLLIVEFCNQYLESLECRYEKTLLNKLNKIFCDVTGDCDKTKSLVVDIRNRRLKVKYADSIYDINEMSDGEKSIIYCILTVLLAKDESIVIVDEPESYINTALVNRLWQILEDENPSLSFLYLTHDMDFLYQRNKPVYWIKKYTYPNEWQIESLDEINQGELPEELFLSLLGNRRNILFCEGTKDSLDFKVYNVLFPEYYVVPVGGCVTVKSYTSGCNNSANFHNVKSIGIIDGDLRGIYSRKKTLKKGIYVLPLCEIEMLLISECVILKVLEREKESPDKINKFKKECFKKLAKNKNRILVDTYKGYLEEQISDKTLSVKKSDNIGNLQTNFKAWAHDLVEDKREEFFKEEIETIITSQNYSSLLTTMILKAEIVKEVANKYLVKDYLKKAIKEISCSHELQSELRKTYFKGI